MTDTLDISMAQSNDIETIKKELVTMSEDLKSEQN